MVADGTSFTIALGVSGGSAAEAAATAVGTLADRLDHAAKALSLIHI